MVKHLGRLAAVGIGLLALVGFAFAVGQYLWPTDCSVVTALHSLTAAILALIAMIRRPSLGSSAIGRASGIALLLWIILATVTEQFAWAHNSRGVLVGVAWLVPPAVGAVGLLERGEWVAGAGCTAALFAGTTALAYTVTNFDSGAGLFMVWLG